MRKLGLFTLLLLALPLWAQNKGTPLATTGIPAPMLYDSGDPISLGYPCEAAHTGIPFYNMTSGAGRPVWICNGTNWIQAQPAISGTTVSIGGALLALGGITSGTATVTGAVAGQVCIAGTSDGTFISGVTITCNVTSANTVTVTLQATVAGTPPAKTYNVKIFQ